MFKRYLYLHILMVVLEFAHFCATDIHIRFKLRRSPLNLRTRHSGMMQSTVWLPEDYYGQPGVPTVRDC